RARPWSVSIAAWAVFSMKINDDIGARPFALAIRDRCLLVWKGSGDLRWSVCQTEQITAAVHCVAKIIRAGRK
ncbi:MAG: hypothetical protein ACN6PK_13885, partial [Pseudomonas shirazensis]